MHVIAYIKYLLALHGVRIHELVVPIILFIDCYYRLEWFEMHTTWGEALLGWAFTDLGGAPVEHAPTPAEHATPTEH